MSLRESGHATLAPLFAPQPRAPRTYAERCLLYATGRSGEWEQYPDGLTDAQLHTVLTRRVLHCSPGLLGHAPDGSRIHLFVDTDTLRLWAVGEHESELEASKRPADYSGTGLMNAVRELRGIWRPS